MADLEYEPSTPAGPARVIEMRRVLFVDDEPRVLEGIENLMFSYVDEWDMEFASSGQEAIQKLGDEPFDVLVTDMRMPGMDGATLLNRVKDMHPGMVRIVLSGHAELEAALRALPIAHQFLSKPCDVETLTGVLERACALNDLVSEETLRSLLGGVSDLPARPATYSRITEALAKEDWSLAHVAAIVERDVAVATKILKVANTAFFNRGTVIKGVNQAVQRLGATLVRDLVLAFEVQHAFQKTDGVDVDALHHHAVLVAYTAKHLCGRKGGEDAFLAGLVHDIGLLVMAAAMRDELRAIHEKAKRTKTDVHLVEVEVLGISHAEIGAYLLGLWGTPYPIMEAVANHHHPSRVKQDRFGILGSVHVAESLVSASQSGNPPDVDMTYLETLGLAERLPEWMAFTQRLLDSGES